MVMTSIEGEIMGKTRREQEERPGVREWYGEMSMTHNNAWKHNIVLF